MELKETRIAEGWKLELMDSGRPLSWGSVVDCRMRIGSAVIDVGGIGGVGTLQEFRRKGYSRRVMEAALALMQRERYSISFLHGIQDFYHRFGYLTCMPEHEFYLDTRDAERAPAGAKTRKLRPGDLPSIARLYNRDNAVRTGSVVRDPRHWPGFRKGTWWTFPAGVQVVVDARSRATGYVVYDQVEDCCRVAEVGGQGEEVFAAILHFLAQRAVKLRRERVWIDAPADHPFAIYCRQFGLRLHSLYPRNERSMGRIIDFPRCMQRILPELARRWGSEERNKTLCIRTDLGEGTLGWKEGRLVLEGKLERGSVQLRQQHLIQLLMGYVRPSDLAGLGLIKLPRDRSGLVERLFPMQEAQLWWPDRF